MKTLLLLAIIGLTFMFGLQLSGRSLNEKLATENGSVSAKSLPLDVEVADKAYETATFGIG